MEKYSTFYIVCSWALLDMLCTVIIFRRLLFVNIFPFLVKAPHTEAEQFQMDQEKSQLQLDTATVFPSIMWHCIHSWQTTRETRATLLDWWWDVKDVQKITIFSKAHNSKMWGVMATSNSNSSFFICLLVYSFIILSDLVAKATIFVYYSPIVNSQPTGTNCLYVRVGWIVTILLK